MDANKVAMMLQVSFYASLALNLVFAWRAAKR